MGLRRGHGNGVEATLERDWPPERTAALRRALLAWYAPRRESQPWRRSRDSYRIWVSEVMLQQTRVAVVRPAYERFVERFPNVAALAEAGEEVVLSQWSGLGYYGRARALHRAAQRLHAQGARQFPAEMDAARQLPGVGSYTAAAVLSIAYGRPHAAVDGNVVRVLSRLACLPPPDARQEPYASLAQNLLDPQRPGDWNQALMEVGQEVCRPRRPRCGACPLQHECGALRSGRVAEFPRRLVRGAIERVAVHLVVAHQAGNRFVLERGVFPYLRHMWLPLSGEAAAAGNGVRLCGSFAHAIVRRRFAVRVLERRVSAREVAQLVAAAPEGERAVFGREELFRLGRSSLLSKSLRLVGFDGF